MRKKGVTAGYCTFNGTTTITETFREKPHYRKVKRTSFGFFRKNGNIYKIPFNIITKYTTELSNDFTSDHHEGRPTFKVRPVRRETVSREIVTRTTRRLFRFHGVNYNTLLDKRVDVATETVTDLTTTEVCSDVTTKTTVSTAVSRTEVSSGGTTTKTEVSRVVTTTKTKVFSDGTTTTEVDPSPSDER